MERGKRASMREGPLAALFRKTEEEGLEEPLRKEDKPTSDRPPATSDAPQQTPAARRVEEPARVDPPVRTPEERLRTVFSSDIPDNVLEKPAPRRRPCRAMATSQRPVRSPFSSPSCASWAWAARA